MNNEVISKLKEFGEKLPNQVANVDYESEYQSEVIRRFEENGVPTSIIKVTQNNEVKYVLQKDYRKSMGIISDMCCKNSIEACEEYLEAFNLIQGLIEENNALSDKNFFGV